MVENGSILKIHYDKIFCLKEKHSIKSSLCFTSKSFKQNRHVAAISILNRLVVKIPEAENITRFV